uniref:Uncharacterized protein n=1 Tax=Ditylenchus dipsaci TaxID=166011 RepID=A0A915D8F0_9BILA
MVPKKKSPGGGRPLLDQDFDNGLAGWVRERRAMKQKVSRTMIVARAEKMFQPTFGSEKKTFSQHGPASGGRLLLKQARENTEIDALIPEEIDIEEDAGNGYESDVSLEWNVM